MLIKVKVFPGAGKETVVKKNGGFEVWTKAEPIKGQANRAVARILSEYFNAEAKLVKGFRERNKIFEIK